MTTKAPIVSHYDKIAFSRDVDRLGLTKFPSEEIREGFEAAGNDWNAELTKRIRSSGRRFLTDFDYEWAFEKCNYSSTFDQTIQLLLIDVMSEINSNHKAYSKLGNICYRTSLTSNVNAESFQSDDYSYLCLTTAFIKYLKEFAFTYFELLSIASERFSEGVESDAERLFKLLESDFEACEGAINRLILTGASYTKYDIPAALAPPSTEAHFLSGPSLFRYGALLIGVDVFVALHELGHLLEHDFANNKRNQAEELEADRAAGSLFIIASAREKSLASVHLAAPALSFSLFRHFNLVRRTMKHISSYRGEAKFNEADELEEEKNLSERAKQYGESILQCYPLIGGKFKRQYQQDLNAFYMIIAATQMILMKSLGREVSLRELVSWPKCK